MKAFSFMKRSNNDDKFKKPCKQSDQKEYITSFSNDIKIYSNPVSESLKKPVEKRISETCRQSDPRAYITSFSTDDRNHRDPVNEPQKKPVEKRKRTLFQKTNFKDFICNDIDDSNQLADPSLSDMLGGSLSNIASTTSDIINCESFDKQYFSKRLERKPKNRPHLSSRHHSRRHDTKTEEIVQKLELGVHAQITSGRFAQKIGTVSFISDDADLVSVRLDDIDREVKLRASCVKVLSASAYQALSGVPKAKKSLVEAPISQELSLSRTKIALPWLFTGLRVRIATGTSDDSVPAMIEDVYDTDECLCQTADGRLISGLKSAALTRVLPGEMCRARVMGGRHLGEIVEVKRITDVHVSGQQSASVRNNDTEEEFDLDLELLCEIE